MSKHRTHSTGTAVKATIAAGAGVALLLGGAGTFAAWNDSTATASGKINTGALSLGTVANGTWTDVTGNKVLASVDGYVFAPNDQVKYTGTVTVKAKGDNLKAKLSYANPTLSAAATDFTVSPTFDTSAAPLGAITGTGPDYAIDASKLVGGQVTLPFSLTITFKDVTGLTDQNLAIDLGQTVLTLTQTAPHA